MKVKFFFPSPVKILIYEIQDFNPLFDMSSLKTPCGSSAGPVTEVKTDIFVTSFGPVSDVEMVSKVKTFSSESESSLGVEPLLVKRSN